MPNSAKTRVGAVVCGFAMTLLLARLGFWQLDRAEQKKRLYERFTERATAPRLPLANVTAHEAANQLWRPAVLTAAPLSTVLLLDNRIHEGVAGYEVLSPMQLMDGRVVLVNRGWLKAPTRRDEWPVVSPMHTLTDAGVRIAPSPSTGIRLGEFTPERGPEPVWRIQTIDFQALATALGMPLEPYQVLLDEDQPGGYARAWVLPGPSSGKNEAYAFQWFAMATAMLALTVYYGFLRPQPQLPTAP